LNVSTLYVFIRKYKCHVEMKIWYYSNIFTEYTGYTIIDAVFARYIKVIQSKGDDRHKNKNKTHIIIKSNHTSLRSKSKIGYFEL